MNDLFIYISLALVVLLFILSSLIYKKMRVWKLIIIILTGGMYGVIRFFSDLITFITLEKASEYYSYFLFFIVIIIAITFKNKIKITQNLTDYDFFELEKELGDLQDVSDLLRMRFISTIGLLNEGIIFYNDDLEGMFVTEQAAEILGTEKSDFAIDDYMKFIHQEDQPEYHSAIKKATRKNPNYEVKYRIFKNGTYVWLYEKGHLFTHNKKDYLVSSLKGIDLKLFPDTMIHELDSIPGEPQLVNYLVQARKEKEVFHLVLMHLTNIPDINQRFGRDVGNLMIAEYIKKMRYHFAREHNSIFRITGIEFALIIKEEQKYDVLKRALVSGGDLINLRLNIGGIQQVVYPNVGVIKNDPWSSYEVNDFMSLAHKTLEEAIRNNKKNFSIYGE
ncbi:MAG: PAS domain-containing protein [Tenericutes bacterium]|nr:PAS domain-containing protein [Mycoplasmatota bacterium]